MEEGCLCAAAAKRLRKPPRPPHGPWLAAAADQRLLRLLPASMGERGERPVSEKNLSICSSKEEGRGRCC